MIQGCQRACNLAAIFLSGRIRQHLLKKSHAGLCFVLIDVQKSCRLKNAWKNFFLLEQAIEFLVGEVVSFLPHGMAQGFILRWDRLIAAGVRL